MAKMAPKFSSVMSTLLVIIIQTSLLWIPAATSARSASAATHARDEESNKAGFVPWSPLKFKSLRDMLHENKYDVTKTEAGDDNYLESSGKTPDNKVKDTTNFSHIKDPCDRYDVDGCSTPFHMPFFFKTLFTPCCDRHDICYHCGVAYDLNRPTCDYTFLHNMRQACKYSDQKNQTWPGIGSRNLGTQRSKLYGQSLRDLIDEKTFFLREILENVMHEMAQDLRQTFRALISSKHMDSLREKVLVKWALALSRVLRERDHSSRVTDEYHVKKSDEESFGSTRFKKEGDVTFSDHATVERSGQEEDSVSHVPARHQTSDPISQSSIPLDDIKELASKHGDIGVCVRVLELADKISLSQHRYRVSEMIVCEDIYLLDCYLFADTYFTAVRIFGTTSYHNTAEYFCKQRFVKGCLPL